MKQIRKIVVHTLMVFFATTLTACAEIYTKPCKEPCSEPQPQDKFVYSIQFNAKTGNLEILDKNNEAVQGRPLNLPEQPLPVDAIINVHTIIEAKGSCLLIVDGLLFNLCSF